MTFLGAGYANWVVTWTLDGSVKLLQTVHMLKNNSPLSAAAIDTKMRTFFTAGTRPYSASRTYIGYTLAKTETYSNQAGTVTYNLNETPIVGTKTSSLGTPVNTSILIKKNTNIVGRRYQGRHMLPNFTISEADISQAGIISGPGLASPQTDWNAAMAEITSDATLTAVLGHTFPDSVPTPYTTVTVQPKIGTMRRRIRGF